MIDQQIIHISQKKKKISPPNRMIRRDRLPPSPTRAVLVLVYPKPITSIRVQNVKCIERYPEAPYVGEVNPKVAKSEKGLSGPKTTDSYRSPKSGL